MTAPQQLLQLLVLNGDQELTEATNRALQEIFS